MLLNIFKKKIRPVLGYFFKLVLCCILLVLVIVVSTTILYRSNYNYLKGEQYEYYKSNLSSISADIENMFYKTVQSSYAIEENPNVKEMLMNTRQDSITMLDQRTVSAYFKKQKAIYGDFIDEILIVDKARGKVINEVSCYDEDFYFDKLSYSVDYTMEKLTQPASVPSKMYVLLSPVCLENKMDDSSKMVVPIVFYRGSSTVLNNPLVINISVEYLQKYLSEHKLSAGSKVIMLDKNSNAYSSDSEDSYLIADFVKNNTGDKLIEKNDKLYISYENSRAMFSGIKYLALIPKADISGKLNEITRMYALCMAICGLIALFISYYVLKTFYRPVTRLMGVFSLGFKDIKNYKNEFEMIEKNIQTIIYNNSSLNAELSSVLPIAGERLLLRLLTKQHTGGISEDETLENIKKSGIHFSHNCFMTAVVDFNYHELFYKKFPEDIRKLIYDSLMPLMLSFFHSPIDIYALEIKENKMCLIINIPDSSYTEDVKKSLDGFIGSFTQDKAFVSVLAGIGTPYEGLGSINRSYEEALNAISGLNIYTDTKLAVFGRASAPAVADITLGEENKLKNYLEHGMEAECHKLINEIIERCSLAYSSRDNQRAVLIKLYTLALAVMDANEINHEAGLDKGIPDDLSGLSENEISSLIKVLYSKIASYFSDNKKDKMAEVVSYIKQNYNRDIYLESVAGDFGLSAKYLSRAFKKYTNTRFVDYLNQLRIDKAKELLSSGSKSISQVAYDVGFNSQSTFYRVFKNSEGITPAEYRGRFNNIKIKEDINNE